MCGIVGALVFDHHPFTLSENYLCRMRDTMTHRGPDGAGLWISRDGRVGLAHRRLSIIDLTVAASQPMANEDETIWISFNGEIYNHAEIRSELEVLGTHQWRTDHSDTEVILHAYEQWGMECLYRFRGMFAIALWDDRKKELYLIRDRIGIKPLYYSIHHGRIVFASEIKALLKDPDQMKAVDEESFYHYLSFLTVPAPRTLFQGVGKVAGGTYLRINRKGQVKTERYWDVFDYVFPMHEARDEDIARQLLDELRKAVQLRKVSDVPVGIFLSGGIDSSTNAALFSEGEKKPIKTFSIGYEKDYPSYPNELHYAKKMAAMVGAEHFERRLSIEDLLNFLPLMVELQDEPIADPVCFPVYYVSKLARDNGVIVCQVGEGSDELFWGYETWKLPLQLQRLNHWPVPRSLKTLGLKLLEMKGSQYNRAYEWLRRGVLEQPVFWGGAEAYTETLKKRLLSPRLRKEFSFLTSWEVLKPIWQRFKEKAPDYHPLTWMTYLDLNLRLPELLLMRVDKMSMGVSLEGRVPFLDHRFVEFAMSIPPQVKTRHGTLKYILKRAVRGLIPDDLIDRKKQGFGVPIREWFFDHLGGSARTEMTAFCRETDFLDPAAADQILVSGDASAGWYLLNFVLWWKAFFRS